MSRIGKKPISIPAGVQVTVSPENLVTVKGKLGELKQQVKPEIQVKVGDSTIEVVPTNAEDKNQRALHGLYRTLIANMVKGVSEGFTIQQELVGVGYKVSVEGQVIEFSLGYSHNLFFQLPPEIKAESVTERGKIPCSLSVRTTSNCLVW